MMDGTHAAYRTADVNVDGFELFCREVGDQ